MPTKDKKRGTYTGKFMFDGEVYRKRGFETIQAARDWEAHERRKLKYPQLIPLPATPKAPSVSFLYLATKYLEDCRARMQRNTVRAKDAYFSVFLAILGLRNFPSEDVTKTQIRDHIAAIQAKRGNKLANRHLKELKVLFRWGINQDIIHKNPAATIEPFAEDPYVKYVPPAKDIDAVLLAADPEEGDMLFVLYHLGARIGEIIRLTWEDVNFEHRWVRLWTRKRKRGQLEADMLPMSDKLYAVLQARWKKRDTESPYVFNRDGARLTRDSDFIRHLIERLCERAQVKRFTFHAIRHHVASVLQDSGKATLKELQLFLRHRRQTTTENYLHQLDPRLTRVVGVLDGGHNTRGEGQPEPKSETTFQ